MIRTIALVLMFAVSLPVYAQEIRIECPKMPVIKLGIGLWECQRIVSVATVKMPDGKKIVIDDFVIEATLVHGVFRRAVAPCIASGKDKEGSELILHLPREPVVLIRGVPTAVAIRAEGTLKHKGTIYPAWAVYPDCPTRRISPREREAAAVTALGKVMLP